MTAADPCRIRLDRVGKRFDGGREALTDLSFDVAAGEVVFLTGHSGAGKSTVLRLIHASDRATQGTVLYSGRNLAQLGPGRVAAHRRRIGVVFQDHRLLLDRTVFDNLALPLLIRGHPRAAIGARVRQVLGEVGLADRERDQPARLSTGQAQRIGIARALIAAPEVLLADEPTGNLDPALSAEIMTLLLATAQRGTTVIIASHDLDLVRQLRRRVLVLDHGRLADDFRPVEVDGST